MIIRSLSVSKIAEMVPMVSIREIMGLIGTLWALR